MIKYNLQNINDWNFGDDNIIKVYYDNAVCYYKVISSGGTTAQTPCFAVVDNISQYQETEFEDVFNKADNSWYKLNNLSQYEKYGLYSSGLTITTYEGKLTIYDGYEYIYSGGSWVYVGEVSGSTATLPDVPFTVNYNAKNYDASTQTLAKTSGQLADVDAVITAGTPTVNDGYLTIALNTRATISGYQTYFNRDSNNPNLTIISKQRTIGSNCHLFANRDNYFNWMYRAYNDRLTLHGTSEQGGVEVTQQPVIESVRVDSNRTTTYNNYTDNTTSTSGNFSYGNTNSEGTALFAGYYTNTSEWFYGDFYWIYMSQNTLTDEQVQQVIAYNEGGGGQPIYPIEYAEKADPPDNVTFSSMTEAEEYECPWWGMSATIDGTAYMFCESNEWLTKYSYVEVTGDYICDNGNKYKKMQEYDRQADGTFSPTSNYVKGDLIEADAPDCGGYENQYLTFVAKDSGTFKFSGNSISYSLDDGNTWATLASNTNSPTVTSGNKIMWKASLTPSTNGIGRFSSTAQFDVEGNSMSLLYGDNFIGSTTLPNKAFMYLFSGCTQMMSAENLILPATTMSSSGYAYMFDTCTSLTKIPELPATTLAPHCYRTTFGRCSSLTSVRENYLPVTTMAEACYINMFIGCTSLTKGPDLLATNLVKQCYQGLFNSCPNLNYIKCLAESMVSDSTSSWTTNVSSTGTFVKSPNMSSWSRGTSGIPNGWTVQDYSE